MLIANLMGTSTTTALEASYGPQRKKTQDNSSGVYSWQPDSVSISDAARALADEAAKTQAPEQGAGQGADAQEQQSAAAGGTAVYRGAESGSAEDIDAKIEKLQKKIVETQSGDMPDEVKAATIAGLQSQISALVEEKNALAAAKKKG